MSEIAVYKNKEYDASINTSKGYVWLRSKSSEELKNGFELDDGVYYKKVSVSEIEAAYKITQYAIIDGKKIIIIGEKDNKITVSFDRASIDIAHKFGVYGNPDRDYCDRTFPKDKFEIVIKREKLDLSKYNS